MTEDEAVRILIEAKDELRVATSQFDEVRLRLLSAERALKTAENGLRDAVIETGSAIRRVEAARILGVTPGRISQIVTGT